MPTSKIFQEDNATLSEKKAVIANLEIFENLCYLFGWDEAGAYIALACKEIAKAKIN